MSAASGIKMIDEMKREDKGDQRTQKSHGLDGPFGAAREK